MVLFNQVLGSSPAVMSAWALILLLPSALAFLCCHGKTTLILIPVVFCWICARQTSKDAHTHAWAKAHTKSWMHGCGMAELHILNTQCSKHKQKQRHINTHSHKCYAHIYCLSWASMDSLKPQAFTDLNADSHINHLSANSTQCWLHV